MARSKKARRVGFKQGLRNLLGTARKREQGECRTVYVPPFGTNHNQAKDSLALQGADAVACSRYARGNNHKRLELSFWRSFE